jgi:hypothetical protein
MIDMKDNDKIVIDTDSDAFKKLVQRMKDDYNALPSWVRSMRTVVGEDKVTDESDEQETRTGALAPWGGAGKNSP